MATGRPLSEVSRTRKQLNRAVRQESLREQLSTQKHVEKVIVWINEMSDPATEKARVEQLDKVVNQSMKLVSKYLPDLKAIEMKIEGEVTQNVISAEPIDAEEWERVYSVETPEGAAESVN